MNQNKHESDTSNRNNKMFKTNINMKNDFTKSKYIEIRGIIHDVYYSEDDKIEAPDSFKITDVKYLSVSVLELIKAHIPDVLEEIKEQLYIQR